jgi:hypothetical protein
MCKFTNLRETAKLGCKSQIYEKSISFRLRENFS